MKILYVITGLNLGGAEKQLIDVIQGVKLLHNTIVISITGDCEFSEKFFKEIRLIELKAKKNIFSLLKGLIRLVIIIRALKPDIVHSHMVHANIITRFVRIFAKIPVLINTAHSKYEGGRFWTLAYRFTDFLTDLTTNVSKEAAEEFIKTKAVKKGKILPVYNGINTKLFFKNNRLRDKFRTEFNLKDETVYITVGRITEAKDYPNLLNAFKLVLERLPTSKLFIVGDGELSNKMKSLSNDLGISKNIYFLGVRNDVHELINIADIFVLSSAWEGFGLVVAEAMANEKIIVATNSGGVKEVLGGNGILVDIKNHLALAAAMLQANSFTKEEKNLMTMKGKEYVEKNFSIKVSISNWLRIYKDIFSQKVQVRK